MTYVHVYCVGRQAAARYLAGGIDERVRIRHPKNRLLATLCCHKRRPAKNLYVQSYYDGDYFTCRPGKGCKVK